MRNQNALKIYNASAGSGKTYTLVKEYLRIILTSTDEKGRFNPSKFRSILAMTFTNKAANEMKDRIIDKLIQLSKKPQDRKEDDTKELQSFAEDFQLSEEQISQGAHKCLNHILHNYSLFSVMTIDKFTHKVIRTFARELGLSLDFDVELDLETLRKNVTDLLFDQIGRNDEITKLMVLYADSKLEEDKSWNFKRNLIEFSNQLFREDAIEAIRELGALNGDEFIKRQKAIQKECAVFENKLIQLGTEASDLIHSKGLSHDDFPGKSNGCLAHFERIASGRTDLRANDKLVTYAKDDDWVHKSSQNKSTVEEIAPVLSKYFFQIEELFDTEYRNYLLNKELLKNINNLSLLNHLLQITEELKEQDNVLLISDFYKKIADVITKEPVPFIYERLGVRYEHFLLDEFQDTSHLQWINLVPLIHNSLATKNTNLIVGDGKQAIYRWRNGEVEQFVNLPDQIYNPENILSLKEAETTFKNEGHKIELKDNYRSAPEIVSFNNGYFDWLASTVGKSYIEGIYSSADQKAKKAHSGFVEFYLPEEVEDDVHLKYVRDVIELSLTKGYSKKDICVLVRKNQEGSDIARYLTAGGIDVVSQDSLWVSKDHTVKFIYNLLRASVTSYDLNYKKKCIEHYYQIFNIEPKVIELDQENWNLNDWFKDEGYALDSIENFHSFYEYIEHIIALFDLELGKNVYLQFFLEQVHVFEKKHNSNIHAFIDWFEEKGYKQSVINPEGADAVNVMSIHKAKGLQFPIVICAFFDWDPSRNKSEKWIINKSENLPAFPLTSSTKTRNTAYKDLMEEEDMKQELDHLNMIYVALTRPETALFVCSRPAKRQSLTKKWMLPYLEKLEAEGKMELSEERYRMGTLGAKTDSNQDEVNAFKIAFNKQLMNKPTLSTKLSDQWDINDLDEKRMYGTQLHLVLSEIKSPDQALDVLERLIRKGIIKKRFIEKIEADLNRLFDHPAFTNYFEQESVLNEQPIIDEKGSKHIPDKVITNSNGVLVVDFKTGEGKTESHKKQLKDYILLLEQIMGTKVEGELFYTEDLEIIRL